MENLLRATLSKAFEAYLIGVTKPIQSNHMITGDAFNNILFSIIDTRLPLDNQLLLYQSYHLRDQGLAAAQKGDLINSERFFKGVETMLLSKKLARESFLLAKSYYEAGIAYLDYRNSNFDKATARIYEALACDVALEEEFGYSILHLHRLQLAHNLMRVYVRQAFLEEALNIGYQLLDYMEGKIVSLSIPTPWDSSKLKPLPKEQVNGMFIQVTYEIVLLLAGNDTMNTSEAFAGARSHTRAKSSESCYLSSESHSWFKTKQALVENNHVCFLEEAASYIEQGPKDTPRLWYAMLADLVILCRRLDIPEARLMRQTIAKDSENWKGVPHAWKSLYRFDKEVS